MRLVSAKENYQDSDATMADHDVQLIHDVQISNFYTPTQFNGSGKIIVALFSI